MNFSRKVPLNSALNNASAWCSRRMCWMSKREACAVSAPRHALAFRLAAPRLTLSAHRRSCFFTQFDRNGPYMRTGRGSYRFAQFAFRRQRKFCIGRYALKAVGASPAAKGSLSSQHSPPTLDYACLGSCQAVARWISVSPSTASARSCLSVTYRSIARSGALGMSFVTFSQGTPESSLPSLSGDSSGAALLSIVGPPIPGRWPVHTCSRAGTR